MLRAENWSFDGLPETSATAFVPPLLSAARNLLERLRQRLAYRSDEDLFWHSLAGFLILARQGFAATCFLVADDRGHDGSPGPFPVHSAVLSRSLLELLGSVLWMVEPGRHAERARLFALDSYKERAKTRQSVVESARGAIPKWRKWIDREGAELTEIARGLGLTVEQSAHFDSLPSWPSAGDLLPRPSANPQAKRKRKA